jgi:transglutaminase-like putative cysteine protease
LNHLNKQKVLLVTIVILGLLSPVISGKEPTQYVYNLSYKFENRGVTDIELTQDDVSIPLFMNSSWQTVQLEEVSQDYDVAIVDSDGNKGAIIGINRLLLPGQEESFIATYKISSTEQSTPSFDLVDARNFSQIPQDLIQDYCVSTETFPSDDPMFEEIASKVVIDEDTVLESVAALVEYIMNNTTYSNFEVPQYPRATMENQLGDCDDQSILLITMCRSLGIPAYLQVGIYIHPSIDDQDTSWEGHLINEADGIGWHGWAMIYIPPWGWVPVDLTLTNAESGLDLIKQAPEYSTNIIPVMNVSKQSYIGATLETRERIIASSIYVTMSDEAHIVYSADNPFQNYLLLGLGAALLVAIGLMFRSSGKQ